MSAIASDKEAHHRVHYYISCQLKNRMHRRNKLANTPHRVLARMDLYYRKENAIRFKKPVACARRVFPTFVNSCHQMKLDFAISPLSMSISCAVIDLLTIVTKYAHFAISSTLAHFESNVSSITAFQSSGVSMIC